MTKKDKTAENVVFRGFIYFFFFYRKLFLIKYILKDSFFQKVLKYCSICVTKGL